MIQKIYIICTQTFEIQGFVKAIWLWLGCYVIFTGRAWILFLGQDYILSTKSNFPFVVHRAKFSPFV